MVVDTVAAAEVAEDLPGMAGRVVAERTPVTLVVLPGQPQERILAQGAVVGVAGL